MCDSMVSLDSGEYPEWDYFMNESVSDVVFVVDGQRVPAIKQILGFRNKVFRAMFDNGFKESNDKEIVIEDTTYEAFKTLIQFLYVDVLVVTDQNDLDHLMQVHKLADRYDARRLMCKVIDQLNKVDLTVNNWNLVAKVAFDYKVNDLLAKVMRFLSTNFAEFSNLQNENYSDVVFVLSEQRLPALRIPILVRNNVLSAKLQDYLKEFDKDEYVIDISSLTSSFQAFKICLDFFYSDVLSIRADAELDLIEQVSHLAHKFQDNPLIDKMSMLVCGISLNENNIVRLADLAFQYKNRGLIPLVMEYMEKNLDILVKMSYEEIIAFNTKTNNRLLITIAKGYTKVRRLNDFILKSC